MSLTVRTFAVACCLLAQGGTDQARVLVFYSHALLESPMGARHVTFDLGSGTDRGGGRQDVTAAFGRAGLPMSTAAFPGPDTIIVALSNVTTDSATGTGRFFHFRVDSRRCVGGRLEHRKSTVSIRCNDQLCYRLDDGADSPIDARESCK
jgi:hypothetical protein